MHTVKKLFGVIILVALLLSGCKQADHLSLGLCGSYAVPGMFCAELKGSGVACDIKDKDSQGRILFSFSTYCNITEQKETAMVICQAINDDYVYFYEDICYFVGIPDNTQLAALKDRNDWEKPLDETKMSGRPNKISFDMWIVPDTKLTNDGVLTRARSVLGVPEDKILDACLLDCSPSGQELLWLRVERDGLQEDFWVIAQTNYVVSLIPANMEKLDTTEIAEFKKSNNWVYGIQ